MSTALDVSNPASAVASAAAKMALTISSCSSPGFVAHRAISFACAVAACASAAAQPHFYRLGFLTEDGFGPSIAYAVSADGSTAVGLSNSDQGFQAFRWTRIDGMVGLGAFPNDPPWSQAFGVSGDGSVIVGASLRPDSLNEDGSPFRWTAATGMLYPGNLGGDSSGGWAFAVTLDGSLMVGSVDAVDDTYHAFRWTEGSGMVALPPVLNQQLAKALAISSDSSVIVGYSSIGNLTNPKPVRWTNAGAELLPMLNPNTIGAATGLSADGSIIVGQSAGRAVRWINNAVQDLGILPGGNAATSYSASACSADGSIIVGLGDFNATQGTGTAVIWDAEHGMRNLNQVLVQNYGLELSGFYCYWARGISADGRVIAGYGFNSQGEQEAFVADLRSGTPCVGDLDGDSQVSLSDLTILLSHFGTPSGASSADGDLDDDDDVDLSDLTLLLAAFGTTCP